MLHRLELSQGINDRGVIICRLRQYHNTSFSYNFPYNQFDSAIRKSSLWTEYEV
jgi:hypothetical protein